MQSKDSHSKKTRAHFDEVLLEISNFLNSSTSGFNTINNIANQLKIDSRTAARCLKLLVRIGKNRPIEEVTEIFHKSTLFKSMHYTRVPMVVYIAKQEPKQEPKKPEEVPWVVKNDVTCMSDTLLKMTVKLAKNSEKMVGKQHVLNTLASHEELPGLVVLNSDSLSMDAWLLMTCIKYHVPFVVCEKEHYLKDGKLELPFDENASDCFALVRFTERQAELYRTVTSAMLNEDFLPSSITLEINAPKYPKAENRPYFFDTYTLLERVRTTGKLVKGVYPTLKAIEYNHASLVVISTDIYPAELKRTIVSLCKMRNVPFVFVSSSDWLGRTATRSRYYFSANRMEGRPIGACAIIRLGTASRMVKKAMDKIRSFDTAFSCE